MIGGEILRVGVERMTTAGGAVPDPAELRRPLGCLVAHQNNVATHDMEGNYHETNLERHQVLSVGLTAQQEQDICEADSIRLEKDRQRVDLTVGTIVHLNG